MRCHHITVALVSFFFLICNRPVDSLFFFFARSGKGESSIHAQAKKKESSKKDTKEKEILTEKKEK